MWTMVCKQLDFSVTPFMNQLVYACQKKGIKELKCEHKK